MRAEGLERREGRADELLHLGDLVRELPVLDRHRAREDVRVATDVPGEGARGRAGEGGEGVEGVRG